jgi:hypothetical protein
MLERFDGRGSGADMMPQARMLPGLNEWQAMNLQLIVFPTNPAAALQREWWEGLTHRAPDESRRRPIERIETGTHNDFNLVATTDIQKISWAINVEIRADSVLDALPVIGDYPTIRDQFRDMMVPWLAERCPQVKRVGFAGTLVQPLADHEASYRRLDAYLATVQVDPKSTDFNYRVNRPKATDLDIPGLIVNRLSTWSALKMQTSLQPVIPTGPTQLTAIQREYYACMIQFDVNTSADREESLNPELLPDLFRELVGKATEIAEQGDQP